jgi:hypothetical protein
MYMAVWVYSTGSIRKLTLTPAVISVTINNRTTSAETYRVILFDTSTGAKTELATSGVVTIGANNTNVVPFSILATLTTNSFEVEIRMSKPHMVPWATLTYVSAIDPTLTVTEAVYGGHMFQDTTLVENP